MQKTTIDANLGNMAQMCADLITRSRFATALTGAGISTAAGIPDFRGPQGLYITRKYDPDTVFDIGYFHRDPLPFFEFTRDFLSQIGNLQPTFTHRFLAQLEAHGLLQGVITQNIDPLHRMAGSKNVIEVHGGYWTSHCLKCGREYGYEEMVAKVVVEAVPHCNCGGVIKPDVVFFGEMVHDLPEAQRLASSSDLMFVLGSSLNVYPAAWLPTYVRGTVVVVNKGPVSIQRSGEWILVDADLDCFFAQVAGQLNM